MTELPMIPLVKGANTRLMISALPCSPVVPERPPGRLRLFGAEILRHLAARLDRGLSAQPGTGHTARPAACVR
jgi:hypothetical protein